MGRIYSMYTVKLLQVCVHMHTTLGLVFRRPCQNISLLVVYWHSSSGDQERIHLCCHNPKCLVLCSFPNFKINTDGKLIFSKGPLIYVCFFVSAIACIKLRQYKLVVESYQLWKESCLSSTKENHIVQRNISSTPQSTQLWWEDCSKKPQLLEVNVIYAKRSKGAADMFSNENANHGHRCSTARWK